MSNKLCVYIGENLASYGFGDGHPFGPDRHDAFVKEFYRQDLANLENVCIKIPVITDQATLESFHTHEYVELVKSLSKTGEGYLDCGDTPAIKGIYESASTVVGTVVHAIDQIISSDCCKAFIPIAGLHHARRDSAAGFCVFNDCGVAIERLRKKHGIKKVAYVDIDAHHGDGVFYSFVSDPDLYFVDVHEDGHYLYPGTGFAHETGEGDAKGSKLNICLPPDAGDEALLSLWAQAEAFLQQAEPEFILFQCGADSMAGDPITHLRLTENSHAYVAGRLCQLADQFAQGRLLAMGGGGYNRNNLARAWCAITKALAK